MIVSENGEQLCKNKVWRKGVRVVKSGVLKIIMYGPYVKSGVEDKKVGIMLIIRYGQYVFGGCKSWEAK